MFFIPNHVCISLLSQMGYKPCPSYHQCVDHCNNIWCTVQIMKILITQFSSASYYIFSLRSHILASNIFSKTLIHVVPQMWHTKFHAYKLILVACPNRWDVGSCQPHKVSLQVLGHVVRILYRKTPVNEPEIPYTMSIFWNKWLCLP
jgi:hypothetical protein